MSWCVATSQPKRQAGFSHRPDTSEPIHVPVYMSGAPSPSAVGNSGAHRASIGCVPAASAPGLGPLLPHLHWDLARPRYICARTGPAPATSAPRLGSPLPHLRRNWAHPCHICTGTGLAHATSAPKLGSPTPHPHRDWAHPGHIRTASGRTLFAGTGLTPAASAGRGQARASAAARR